MDNDSQVSRCWRGATDKERGDEAENRGVGWDQETDKLLVLADLQRAISRNRHRRVSTQTLPVC